MYGLPNQANVLRTLEVHIALHLFDRHATLSQFAAAHEDVQLAP